MNFESPIAAEQSVDSILVQESQRTFMLRVYGWMFGALALTGVSAIVTAASPQLQQVVFGNRGLFFGGTIALVLGLSWLGPRLSGPVAAVMFIVYATMIGMTFSALFLVYSLGSIASAFFVTGGIFGAMTVYGWVTKRDLSSWTSFLFMGLIGFFAAAVVNIFLGNALLGFVVNCGLIVVFVGLTAWDTQKLLRYHAAAGYSSAMSFSIVGALTLYLDFINLFLQLLRMFGRRR